ncbi:hypothetical protein BDY24DRAFT_413458 [Mrakia frigida]|uniref:uncharacterized protein n=1 Tax=Mrakia frigida TaxID=29902 RepID=UPI003FCBFD74
MSSSDSDATTTTSTTPSYILSTPAEIFDGILNFVSPFHLQRTALSLLSVFPHIPVSINHLWKHVVVGKEGQLMPLWRRMREEDGEERGKRVKSFEMRSWKGDADIMNNIIGRMPALDTLRLNVGTNFAPEHLEDAFQKPRPLERILVRFKPYVEKASYYQFLKGTYFDTCLEQLSSWPDPLSLPLPPPTDEYHRPPPPPTLKFLSLVQEVPPLHLVDKSVAPPPKLDDAPKLDPRGKEEERVKGRGAYTGHGPFSYLDPKLEASQPRVFAQPIVFFNTQCITLLSLSPVSLHLTHLRLLIPSRDISSSLTIPSPQQSTVPSSPAPLGSFPSLTYLDLSTTNVRLNTNVPSLLRTYPKLEHLVLDHTNLFGFLGRDREKGRECARELGKMCSVDGVERAKVAERLAKRWVVDEQRRRDLWRRRAAEEESEERARERAAEEEGEAEERDELMKLTSEFEALTQEEYKPTTGTKRNRGVKSMALSKFSIRSDSRNTSTASSSTSTSRINPNPTSLGSPSTSSPDAPPNLLIFILPPPPLLKTVSLGGEASLTPIQRKEWKVDFESGWKEGLERTAKWALEGVGARFERSCRAIETQRKEWEKWLERGGDMGGSSSTTSTSGGGSGSSANAKGKGKANAPSKVASSSKPPSTIPTPPPQILLLRFPTPSDPPPPTSPLYNDSSMDLNDPQPSYPPALAFSPLSHLIEVDPSSSWREIYSDLVVPETAPRCVFCTVAADPAGGPLRRGGEEVGREKREEMRGVEHEKGCGHRVGREVWGEEE